MKIAVAKETRYNEQRVAIIPEIAKRLIALGAEVIVEENAGLGTGFSNKAYLAQGATIAENKADLYKGADLVTWVKRPEKEAEDLKHIPSQATIVGFLDPLEPGNHIQSFASKGLTTISWELLPHTQETEQMDALAAMSKIAGKIAYQNALETVTAKKAPAGTFTVLIIGSGNVGMAATQQAQQDGNRIVVASTNDKYKELIEQKLSGKFVSLARDRSQSEILTESQQQEKLQEVISVERPDIIISTARRYKQKAPLLITEATLDVMKPGTVIEDLTTNEGGNTPFTSSDQEVELKNGILIRNKSNYPSQDPLLASRYYGECLGHLLEHILKFAGEEPNYNVAKDPLLSQAVMTHDYQIWV